MQVSQTASQKMNHLCFQRVNVCVCFTCCSRNDSLRVQVSEEEAVDQGGFSKSRFTFR